MPFDFTAPDADGVRSARALRGKRAHLGGLAAEEAVARHYRGRGAVVARRRWRGLSGEVDLILREGERVVFVEVKSGPDFDRALARITARQVARIFGAAEEFLDGEPAGTLTDVRVDLALVDGRGMVRVMENAFAGM